MQSIRALYDCNVHIPLNSFQMGNRERNTLEAIAHCIIEAQGRYFIEVQ